jgi:hypothetical protein
MTRKEAIKVLNMVEAHGMAYMAKNIAIKALEESEELHDKIKADYCGGYTGLDMEEVLHIIDKYKGGADDGEENQK